MLCQEYVTKTSFTTTIYVQNVFFLLVKIEMCITFFLWADFDKINAG